MKGILILADYFEDIEALVTYDLLRRAKIDIDLVSMTNSRTVVSQYNLKLQVRKLINEIKLSDYDFLIIPGGKAVSLSHLNSEVTKEIVMHFSNKNQLIATICAAPAILGQLGLLKGKKFTCFPSFEKYSDGGKYYPKKDVIQDGNIITARAAGSAFLFAYKIISFIKGKEKAKEIQKEIID